MIFFHFIQGSVLGEFKSYPNKRLTNIFRSVKVLSAVHCTTWCSMTDGCLAVNVIGNHNITCELTTGLSNENEMEDDSSSKLLILGRKLLTNIWKISWIMFVLNGCFISFRQVVMCFRFTNR